MECPLDIDPGFEPQTRARSNTWPLPRPDNFEGPDEKEGLAAAPKKNSSRRNAWGNMSYADLITQAIQSSPEKRLTLAQIYEWMVQNVAYFKDKGDSNSSAGWKNSIRHNLSLHNRFMRVQNEGTGKSSWWMINPDAKPGKAARRRATSMETHKYEKKRGRVRKKVEALRGTPGGATPSPASSEGQDLFPDSPVRFRPLSPDFRPRASSNASSCGGRLSPIPAVESDASDMPPLSPVPWSTAAYEPPPPPPPPMDRFSTEHLVKSLSESMKLRNGGSACEPEGFGRMPDCAKSNGRPSPQQMAAYTMPPYYDYRPPAYQQPGQDTLGAMAARQHSPTQPQQQVIETVNGRPYTLTRLQTIQQQQHTLSPMDYRPSLSYVDSLEPLYKDIKEERLSPILPSCNQQPAPPYHLQQQQHSSTTSLVNTASHVVGHLLYNSLPQDLDFEPLPGGLECDVDQVIRHELSVDGNLDFNFDPSSSSGSNSGPQQQAIAATRSWVH